MIQAEYTAAVWLCCVRKLQTCKWFRVCQLCVGLSVSIFPAGGLGFELGVVISYLWEV